MTKARDIADFRFENITDTGTEGTKIASGTTAQRGTTQGQLRYNTTTNLFEFRDNTSTTDFLSAPQITSVDVVDVQTDLGGNETFVITGKNFKVGAVVSFVDNSNAVVNATSTTRNSDTQLTVVVPRSSFSNANEPYDIKLVNGDALQAVLENQINVDNNPVWQTNASLPTMYENLAQSVQLSATDSDGDTVTYSITSGSLPSPLVMSSSGLITGTLGAFPNATTYTFTVRATANSKTADRQFTQVVQPNTAPTWSTASGSLGILYDSARSAVSGLTQPTATDAQGQAITYAVTSGALPTGLTLNSDGSFAGTANAETSDTTYTFEITPTDSAGVSGVARQFTIEVKAPVLQTFSTYGTGTWTAPLTGNIKVLVIGGAGGYGHNYGRGGAGGVVWHDNYAVVSGTDYDYEVGESGSAWHTRTGGGNNVGKNGGSSKFGISGNSAELIALGGGGGMHPSGSQEKSAGSANEGSYMGNVGSQVQNCYKPTASLGTQQGVGATIYGGYRAGTSNMQHYAWDTAGSAGANGNGSSVSRCGGNANGGAGVDFTNIDSDIAGLGHNGHFSAGWHAGGGYGGTTGTMQNGYNAYGGAGTTTGAVILKY